MNFLVFGFKRFLLYGTGSTPTFSKLRQQGVEVVGCDINRELVNERLKTFGPGSFYLPRHLPAEPPFDGIVAVEVFEHFTEPGDNFRFLVTRLAEKGIICGTTDFYPGGPLEDRNNYMKTLTHVSYWSLQSLTHIARLHGCRVRAFEMVRPGSVLPALCGFGTLPALVLSLAGLVGLRRLVRHTPPRR